MKLSIITVCYNSEKTILDTINSVNSQTYKNIEHIFVDGGSTDKTIKFIQNNPNKKKIIIKKKSSIYEAMNIGIKRATGSIIQILNSDDILQSNVVIENVITKVKKHPNCNIFLGNVIYFSTNNFYKINRYYTSTHQKIKNIPYGEMPPHPSSFIKKKIYNKYGVYNTQLKIAADFNFFLKTIFVNKQKYKILNQDVVRMRSGGASDNNIISYIQITLEILKSLKNFHINKNLFRVSFRGYNKLKDLFKFNQKKLNKNFKLFKFEYCQDEYNKKCFKIIKSLNALDFKKNFILSGMNLAFLGFYCKNVVYPLKNLYHWPDGIFIKKIIDIKKIPGRDIVKKLIIPKNINNIHVIGNISNKSINYLKKKFKLSVFNSKLPYGNIDELIKFNIKLKKNSLIFITLPTPKQEQLAYHLAKINKNYKIVCIGGSIAIASGEETQVPKFMQNYEFLWRLNNDFFRRLIRLLESFYFFMKGKYIKDLYNQTIFRIIE